MAGLSFDSAQNGLVGPRPSKRQGYMIMNKEQNVTTNNARGLYKD